jgi:kumamolisin
MASADRVAIPGSHREIDPKHPRVGDADHDRQIDVTVYLRPSASLEWVDEEAARPPSKRRTMSRHQLGASYGASHDDIAAVRSFAADHGLEVTAVNEERRAMTLRGTVDAVAKAFAAQELGLYKLSDGIAYRSRSGSLTVPGGLSDVITGVFGIDERPQAKPHVRFHPAAAAAPRSYAPDQVAAAYNFPTGINGAGEAVAIIELGGGFTQTELDQYFSGLGVSPPPVIAVEVGQGTNSPGTDPNADGEVMLDIEVVGAVAPGAQIVVYFAENTDQGFVDAVSTAAHDATNKPSVISISWGAPEDAWTGQARTQMEQAFTEAAALGVTVTVASGDNGSTDGVNDGKQHVDFPAAAPHALACGGTSLQVDNGQITSETVWNNGAGGGAGGGGVSIEFTPAPSYQTAINPTNVDTGQPGRGVPDVAGDADPATGYTILVDGRQETIGGTSAVAPLWAGLIALLNQGLGRSVGFLQPQLYTNSVEAGFQDITDGDNGSYQAASGWDACTGLGSPNGAAILQALGGQVPAKVK